MKKALRKLICLAVVLCALLQGTCAFAAEVPESEEQTGSIAVTCPADGAVARLWYLGSFDSSGKITLEGDFAAYSSVLNPNSKDAAATLANMATGAVTPTGEQTVKDGTVGFKGLKKGAYLLSVSDVTVDGRWYRCSPMIFWLPYDDGNGTQWNLIAEIKHESGEAPGSLTVKKVWSSDSGSKRPEKITVEIYCGGELYNTVTLNKSNSWSYSWKTEGQCDWSVREKGVPTGYKVQISAAEYGFKIVNTGTEEKPPRLPQTGQLWWPVPVLLSAGLLLLVIGAVRRKRS